MSARDDADELRSVITSTIHTQLSTATWSSATLETRRRLFEILVLKWTHQLVPQAGKFRINPVELFLLESVYHHCLSIPLINYVYRHIWEKLHSVDQCFIGNILTAEVEEYSMIAQRRGIESRKLTLRDKIAGVCWNVSHGRGGFPQLTMTEKSAGEDCCEDAGSIVAEGLGG